MTPASCGAEYKKKGVAGKGKSESTINDARWKQCESRAGMPRELLLSSQQDGHSCPSPRDVSPGDPPHIAARPRRIQVQKIVVVLQCIFLSLIFLSHEFLSPCLEQWK